MQESTQPKWMSDPLVADIDKNKLAFLQSVVFETKGKSQKELLPFLMGIMKKVKSQNISFTNDEMSSIMTAIKQNSTPEELAQIDKFMAMHKNNMFKPQSNQHTFLLITKYMHIITPPLYLE